MVVEGVVQRVAVDVLHGVGVVVGRQDVVVEKHLQRGRLLAIGLVHVKNVLFFTAVLVHALVAELQHDLQVLHGRRVPASSQANFLPLLDA